MGGSVPLGFERNRAKAFRNVAAQQCCRLQHEGIENILFLKERNIEGQGLIRLDSGPGSTEHGLGMLG